MLLRVKTILASLFLFAVTVAAQSYQTATILKWKMEPYSQSAHIIRNHIVYSIRIGESTYQIARRSKDVEMNSGQQVDCRMEKNSVLIRNPKGKEIKYEIIGSE
jgi:hypothetical protein